METFSIATSSRCELVEITGRVAAVVEACGASDGIAVIYIPHTTAAVTINENADPSVARDIVMKTSKLAERRDRDYTHGEGNSDAHVKASMLGSSETVIIEEGRLRLGTWQGIFLAEFDGPRNRRVWVKVISG
ncbi:MAG TPA: YjbQ family protein [Deltaproteobacteria bacterium]|nr:YjbQ family protein [Deltaproteobacteria bacterium]